MAKRSPILGYNHNVKYRGLIFHVQTEDSGLLSPHLFTHLFHSGVIISTRKLVYDAGSAEDSIKSLMQAQHKAVMKDLKKGHFDDKIDVYLAGTPGLLPRGVAVGPDDKPEDTKPGDGPRLAKPSGESPPVSTDDITASKPTEQDIGANVRARVESENLPMALKPTKLDVGSDVATPRTVTPTRVSPPSSRTRTAEKGSAPTAVRSNLPPTPVDFDPPTETDSAGSVSEAIYGATTRMADGTQPVGDDEDSSPEIEIQLEVDDDGERDGGDATRARSHRDTDLLAMPDELHGDETRRNLSDGIPGALTAPSSSGRVGPNEAIPPLPPPVATGANKSSLGAASLPPARPISRPPSRPAIQPPQVISRPVEARADQSRERHDSDAIEVFAPAPPSVEAPPGAQGERPGQYSQHSRRPTHRPGESTQPKPSSTPSAPIPAGLNRPRRMQSPSATGTAPPARDAIPQPVRDTGSAGTRPRTPTPSRVNPTNPRPNNNSGVVMTRPAVIVGAPPKAATTTGRIRKAREDEGRGFGQGLISEKSLDEVILAYLSEDADDK